MAMMEIPEQPGRNTPVLASRASADGPYVICAALLLSSLFLQKFAMPGSGSQLSLSLVAMVSLVFVGLLAGHLVVSLPTLAALFIFVLFGLVSLLASPSLEASLPALALVAVVQFPLALRASGPIDYDRFLHLANSALTWLAVFGIVQFFGQFLFGTGVAFAFDVHMPSTYILEPYNHLNHLYYGSEYYKSNGIFLVEPSFFCQYLSIGLLIELLTRRRLTRVAIYLLGLLLSFSGTGLLMLALVLPFLIVRQAGLPTLVGLGTGLVGAVLVAPVIGLGFLVERLNEFTTTSSSAFARFLSPLQYNRELIIPDAARFWLGRGPGTVREFFPYYPYEPHDPTWSKLFYEYGSLGTIAYLAFFASAMARGWRLLVWPLVITFFLLGGYLATPFIIAFVAALAVWPGGAPRRLEGPSSRARSERFAREPVPPPASDEADLSRSG